jgi:hypothetical protein
MKTVRLGYYAGVGRQKTSIIGNLRCFGKFHEK